MVVEAAATAAQSDAMAIAVVDRMGRILAVYVGPLAPATAPGNFGEPIPTGIWQLRSRAPAHSSATIKLRYLRAQCVLSAGYIFRREL